MFYIIGMRQMTLQRYFDDTFAFLSRAVLIKEPVGPKSDRLLAPTNS